jgi:hypothetical protein
MMAHIDEYTLELYILDDEKVHGQRGDIERHLKECCGCAALAEEMESFHRELADSRLRHTEIPERPEKALLRRTMALAPSGEYLELGFPLRQLTPLGKVAYFIRKHPVVSGTAGFVLMGSLAVALGLLVFKANKAPPAYTIVNPATYTFQVYSKESDLCWEIPIDKQGLEFWNEAKADNNTDLSIVDDLKGTGVKEVITALHGLGMESGINNTLRIFSADRSVRRKILFEDSAVFNGSYYEPNFYTQGLDTIRDGAGKKELLLLLNHIRSPSELVKLSPDGEILARWWHFGHLNGPYCGDIDGDGHQEVVLCGANDVNDTAQSGSFATAIVLRPDDLKGTTESVGSRGFGHDISPAERFYIKFPKTDVHSILHASPLIERVKIFDENNHIRISFNCISNSIDGRPVFEYILSGKMEPLTVRNEMGTVQLYDRLRKEGQIRYNLDAPYLESLKSRIQFWNGKEWKKEVTDLHNIF